MSEEVGVQEEGGGSARPALTVTYRPTAALIPYVGNAKVHEPAQISQIAASIKEFGFNNPILLDGQNGVIAGHGRLEAAQKLGMEEVPTIDLSHLTDAQRRAYILADNRLGEVNTSWDFDLVSAELDALKLDGFDIDLTGFDDAFILGDPTEGLTDEDEVPPVPDEPVTVTGDVWVMGEHRLMCGDSLSIDALDRLMVGRLADVVFTDPPYNTGMKPQPSAGEKARLSHMFDDDYSDDEWEAFMADFCSTYFAIMKENTGAYICLDWRRNHELVPHIKRNFKLSNVIVWDKMVHGLGSDYKYTYELINVCKKGKPEMDTHQGEREYSDVWHIQREMGRNKDHATAKPVAIVERCLRHASKPNSLCVDLFMGSGTTLAACEKLGRVCYGADMAPEYVDVSVTRWQNFTGRQATLEGDGRTFDEVRAERVPSASTDKTPVNKKAAA